MKRVIQNMISPWSKTAGKLGFCTGITDGRTDGPTNGRTDRPSNRDARTHLITRVMVKRKGCFGNDYPVMKIVK